MGSPKKTEKYEMGKGSVKRMIDSEETLPVADSIEAVEIIPIESNAERLRNNKPIDKNLRAKAFELYMTHHSWDEIVSLTGIKKGTLLGWAGKEHWGAQRTENDNTTLGGALETKKYKLSNIVMKILDGVEKAIDKDVKRGLNPKQIAMYLAALSSVEKLNRLTNGLATSISEERTKRAQFTLPLEHLKEIQSVKIADPFHQLEQGVVESVETPREAGPSNGDETT